MYKIYYRQTGKDEMYRIWHKRSTAELILVIKGNGSVVLQNKIYPIQEGALYFVANNVLHYTLPEDCGRYVRSKLMFPAEILSLIPGLSGKKSAFAPLPEEIFNQAEQLFQKSDSEAEMLSNTAMLLSFLIKHESESITIPETPVSAAIDYINRNIRESLTIDDISRTIHISKFHLCRKFKEQTSLTIMEYILKTRLELAKQLLSETGLTVNEISESCGFSSLSYFSRVFREKFETTAWQYRKNCKKRM